MSWLHYLLRSYGKIATRARMATSSATDEFASSQRLTQIACAVAIEILLAAAITASASPFGSRKANVASVEAGPKILCNVGGWRPMAMFYARASSPCSNPSRWPAAASARMACFATSRASTTLCAACTRRKARLAIHDVLARVRCPASRFERNPH